MADMVNWDEVSSVVDLGCGQMWLREYLPAGVSYTCCDYVDRGGDLIADFNKGQFLEVSTDVAFVSGCLEYVDDQRWFLGRVAAHSPRLVISYCSTDRVANLDVRRNHGWRNHLSSDQLRLAFLECGFDVWKAGAVVGDNEIYLVDRFAVPSRAIK